VIINSVIFCTTCTASF